VAEVLSSNASTYAIGMDFPSSDLSGLSGLTSAAGGSFFTAASPLTTPDAMRQVMAGLHDQYRVSYTSGVTPGHAGDLEILAPGLAGRAQVVPGGVSVGSSTNPSPVHLRQAPGLLQGKAGLLLIAVLVLAAAAALTYAAALLVSREGSALTSALIPFSDTSTAEKDDDGSLIQSAFVQRAVDATGRLARERGLLEIIENKLEQANLALRPAEALFIYLVGAVLVTVVALVAGGPLLALIALVGVGLAPPAVLSFLAAQRLRKFTSQLPDTLQLLASSLRAGFSFLQGVEAVAQEVDDPMGSELRRVIVEARLGRPVEESLDDCARRMQSDDFDWAVMAVNIQREVGGNLADLLQTVSVTMIERERLRRDVKALTAEGRMSAIVLGCLPPGLALVFYATNPAYIRVLFTHVGGQIALGLAVLAMLIGFFWMKKIVDIKV
jgi:tight adherence protein B